MHYWPLTPIMRSSELKLEYKHQIAGLGKPGAQMSYEAMASCRDIAYKMPPCTSLVVVCSEGAPMRRVYLKRPPREEWNALERGGFVDAFNNFGFVMDALH